MRPHTKPTAPHSPPSPCRRSHDNGERDGAGYTGRWRPRQPASPVLSQFSHPPPLVACAETMGQLRISTIGRACAVLPRIVSPPIRMMFEKRGVGDFQKTALFVWNLRDPLVVHKSLPFVVTEISTGSTGATRHFRSPRDLAGAGETPHKVATVPFYPRAVVVSGGNTFTRRVRFS